MSLTGELPKNPNKLSGEVGKDFLLYVDKGTAAAPSWTLVGGQRGLSLSRTADEIDVTNKTTGGWSAKKAGLRTWSVDVDGLIVLSDEGLEVLETAFNEAMEVHVKFEYPDQKFRDGWGSITDMSIDAPHDGEATLTCTIAGNGPLSVLQEASAGGA